MYRVVIVEDEKVIRKGIIYVIDWAALDCLVVGEAENGQQGLDMIERLHPDIVITDVRMPLMDGLEMVRKGREKQSFETILLSAYDDFDYVQQALHLEACEYLLKPVDNEKLTKAIAGACRKTDRKNEVRWRDYFNVAVAGEPWLDFTIADKGSAIRQLGRILSIPMENIMAIGDNYNDVTMLHTVGMPVLMENAAEDLKNQFQRRCVCVTDVLKTL